jgi:outer membrane murein-binding lipoprotein Lpp
LSTYDHQQVLADYTNGRITAEMAVGHCLQHIGKLYEAQTAANLSRYDLRSKVDTLENKVNALQKAVDRLTASGEKSRPKRKRNASDKS